MTLLALFTRMRIVEESGYQFSPPDQRLIDRVRTPDSRAPGLHTPSSSSSLRMRPGTLGYLHDAKEKRDREQIHQIATKFVMGREILPKMEGMVGIKSPASESSSRSDSPDLPTILHLRVDSSNSPTSDAKDDLRIRHGLHPNYKITAAATIDTRKDTIKPQVSSSFATGVKIGDHETTNDMQIADWAYRQRDSHDLEEITLSSSSSRSTSLSRDRHYYLGRQHPNLPIHPPQSLKNLRHTLNKQARFRGTSSGTPDEVWSRQLPSHLVRQSTANQNEHRPKWPRGNGYNHFDNALGDLQHRGSSHELKDRASKGMVNSGVGLRIDRNKIYANRPRRPYKRQPIGRNWSPFRKRIAAIVACFNTAITGIMVGIYVSKSPHYQALEIYQDRLGRFPVFNINWPIKTTL